MQIEVHNISIILKCEHHSNSVFVIPKLITYFSLFKSSGIFRNRLPWWLSLLLDDKLLNLVQRWWYMRQHPDYQFLYQTTTKQKKHSPKNFSKHVTVTTRQLTNKQTDTTAGCTLVITGTHQVVSCQAKWHTCLSISLFICLLTLWRMAFQVSGFCWGWSTIQVICLLWDNIFPSGW